MGSTSVAIEPLSTHDAYGVPAFGAASTYDCIYQEGRRLVQRSDGRTEVSTHTVFVLSTSASVGLQDRLTVPGTTEQPRILAVDHVRDDKGQHHVEVMIG